ncbi:hypothetical protein [Arthrobacter sp. NPDC090010]
MPRNRTGRNRHHAGPSLSRGLRTAPLLSTPLLSTIREFVGSG